MKKRDIEIFEREALAVERGEITPGRVWKVIKRPDGTVERKAINPETHRSTLTKGSVGILHIPEDGIGLKLEF